MTPANGNPAELAGIDRAGMRLSKISLSLMASTVQPTLKNRNWFQAQEASK